MLVIFYSVCHSPFLSVRLSLVYSVCQWQSSLVTRNAVFRDDDDSVGGGVLEFEERQLGSLKSLGRRPELNVFRTFVALDAVGHVVATAGVLWR